MMCQVLVNACELLFEGVCGLGGGQEENPPTVKQFFMNMEVCMFLGSRGRLLFVYFICFTPGLVRF